MATKRLVWAVAALLAAVAAAATPAAVRFFRVDACLDRGGRWNDADGACEWHERF